MLLHRLIVLVVAAAVLAIAVPRFAPGLIAVAVHPAAKEEVSPVPAPAARPPQIGLDTGSDPSAAREPPRGRTVALRADPQGHYQVEATVNGRTLAMLVDTGATTVALNAAAARRLGLYLSRSDYTVAISTANGLVAAAPVRLSEIRLGGISVRNVPAVVLPGEVLSVNLLGMSFLSRLSKFEIADGHLVLEQ